MSEVKEIFSSVSSSAKTESDVDLLSECLNFQLENIQFHIEIQREDQPIIYYVAGAISRAILKRTKCEKCLELLSAGNLEVVTTNFENMEGRREFISKLSRGGLLKPSDVVYITCIHAFVFYQSVKDNTVTFEFLVNSTELMSVFTKSFVDILNESNSIVSILNTDCKKGHKFSLYLPQLTNICFMSWRRIMCPK